MAARNPESFTFRLPRDLKDALERAASAEDVKPAWLIRRALRRHLIDAGYLEPKGTTI